MTTTTTTRTTLADLAQAVNRLIEEKPDNVNPKNGSTCVYHDPITDKRCIIGQALYDLTGWNMPEEFEDNSIESLLDHSKFRNFFGLEFDYAQAEIADALVWAQGLADEGYTWGSLKKINVDA